MVKFGKRFRKRRKLPFKKAVGKVVKRAINRNIELKHHNQILNYSPILVAPNISLFDMTAIPQGIIDVNRVGDKATLRSCRLRMILEKVNWQVGGSAPVGSANTSVRVLVMQWKPTSTPLISEFLNPGPTGVVDVMSEYNHDTRQQYHILKDKTFVLTPATSMARHQFTWNFNLRKIAHNLQFTNGTNVGTNHLYLSWFIDSTVAGATLPNVAFHFRTYFTDA